MVNNKPLSFSGYKRFITCPKYFYFHDIQGEKHDIQTSALVFGSAIDNALNVLLSSTPCTELLDNSKTIAFDYIKNTKIDSYFPADFDFDLSEQILIDTLETMHFKGDHNELINELLQNQGDLSVNEKKLLDIVCKDSLLKKASIILDAYYLKVLPIVDKVESVQKEIITPDGKLRGIIDTIIILKDGRRVIFDNKTASKPYVKGSVLRSPQLALYASMVNADHAGFIVMNKQLTKNRVKICSKCGKDGSGTKFRTCNNIVNKKKCGSEWKETINPYSFIQIQIDKMPKINKDIVNEALYETIQCVNNGVFPRNLNVCFNQYGKECPYVKKCWEAK